MIELTPLDVRKKKGDFRRGLRGYEAGLVDDFLDVVADRMEALVREAASATDRIAKAEQLVAEYRDREKALTEALVTAQQMREEIRAQSRKEVEQIRIRAEQDAEALKADAVAARAHEEEALATLRSKQLQFMSTYRTYLEREISDLVAMGRALETYVAGTTAAEISAPPAAPARRSPSKPAPEHPEAAADPAASSSDTSGPVGASTATSEPQASVAETHAPPVPGPAAPVSVDAWSPDDMGDEPKPGAVTSAEAGSETGAGAAPADELEAQLEEALARWEPELGEADEEDAAAAEVLEDLELLLGDDDVVNGARPPEPAEDDDSTDDEDDIEELMDFLALDDDEEADGPAEPAAARAVAESDEVTTSMSGPAGRAEFAYDEGPDDDGLDDVSDLFGEDPAAEASAEPAAQRDDDPFEVLDGPPEPDPVAVEDVIEGSAQDDAASFDMESHEGQGQADRSGGDAFAPDDHGSGDGLIDLDSFRLTRYEPDGGTADTSSLTLHPMFFDQESPDVPALGEGEKSRSGEGDRWNGSGKG